MGHVTSTFFKAHKDAVKTKRNMLFPQRLGDALQRTSSEASSKFTAHLASEDAAMTVVATAVVLKCLHAKRH